MQLAVVLEKGSISEAARFLSLTQPTVTRNMGTLEMQAGSALFSRSRYGVRSTALGEALAREGRTIAKRMQEARETIARHKLGVFDQLRLGIGPMLGLALMPALTPRFLQAHPHVALTVTSGRPTTLVDDLIEDHFDAVLTPAVYKQVPPGIARRLLAHDSIGVFCAVTHPLATVASPDAGALSRCDWINVGIASPFQDEESDFLLRNGIQRPHTRFATVNDAAVLLAVLRQGRHLAVLPRLPIGLIDGGRTLREIALPGGPSPRDIMLWCRQSLEAEPIVQSLRAIASALLDGTGARPDPEGPNLPGPH